MRIAIPVQKDLVSPSLAESDGFRFFEDDHGAIVRRFSAPLHETGSAEAALALLGEYGVDALLCGALPSEEKLLTAREGIPLFPFFSGEPESAARAFLSGAVARDPSNTCNACGFQSACSLRDKGGCGGNAGN